MEAAAIKAIELISKHLPEAIAHGDLQESHVSGKKRICD